MSQPVTLAALSPREAVADALSRCILGIDNNDKALFESAILRDESITFVAGLMVVEGWTALNELFRRLFSLVTTHIISNIRTDLKDDASTAYMTAHALAYHVRPDDALKSEDTSYTASCLYFIGLVKDSNDDLWRIKRWEVKVLWTTGDRAVVYG